MFCALSNCSKPFVNSALAETRGLLESTKRGFFRITPRGLNVLQTNPHTIDVNFLKQYPEFLEFQGIKKENDTSKTKNGSIKVITPEEAIEEAYQTLREELAGELIETVKICSPAFFERLVVDLLVKMGYGGTRKDAGQAIGKTGDDGIDGIIKEDRLGLDTVYIQAKRWEGSVSRPEIQKFAGALQGYRARKGVFITTSSFSKSAQDYVTRIESKIVLIDGELLAQLMIDFDLGVSQIANYSVKQMDSDYFE
jgi:restriction system protein